MKQNISAEVIDRYLAGDCTADEIAEVHQWFSSFDHIPEHLVGLPEDEQDLLKEKLLGQIIGEKHQIKQIFNSSDSVKPQDLEIRENSQQGETRIFRLWPKIAVAVSMSLIIGVLFYSVRNSHKKAVNQNAEIQQKDISPGGNNAVLTLADGSEIVLNQAKKGLLTKQGNVKISKTSEGKLVYNTSNSGTEASNAVSFNMVRTPKGGQYEVVLPDGTKVWLNALSYLKFPTAFNGKTRLVEVSGEAYFEVTKNMVKPFVVKSARAEVTVLGTHFNVNDYADETSSRTTLLEGSVSIKGRNTKAMLRPGDQAVLNENDVMKIAEHVDTEEAVAWKNGIFEFNGTDITTIMRQVARWYDINVTYTGNPDHGLYNGTISRNVNLSEMLTMIRYMGVNYTLDGKNLIIKN
ncbi:FecR family protein [Mucilaginibacter dorajii]|uniref:DUF4974 domain-containing protein n=1 Tax=Mucilaginibacter dorajii TaxID=692994 RepID=A0ABP7R065_9SPHI|nr:FecR family protein [Mucilaginibacter dorajii]MCS3732300.1 ferric-dicitrate binding protein FerR (iron transport regulator) [Mucilaginibacter dorajii]